MTAAEFRRLVRSMAPAKKDELIELLYKRSSKEDKEMLGLITKAISEGKEPPAASAVIVNLKKSQKLIDSAANYAGSWRSRGRGARFTTLRKNLKGLLHDLPLMPAEAQGYEEACRQYRDLMRVLGSLNARFDIDVSWMIDFEALYRTACTMEFGTGYKMDSFERLLELAREFTTTGMNGRFLLVEILCSMVHNGDLRFDLIEHAENRLRAYKDRTTGGEEGDRQLVWSVFYILLMNADGAVEAAFDQLKNLFDERYANSLQSSWRTYQNYSKREEEGRLDHFEDEDDLF